MAVAVGDIVCLCHIVRPRVEFSYDPSHLLCRTPRTACGTRSSSTTPSPQSPLFMRLVACPHGRNPSYRPVLQRLRLKST